MSKVVLTTKVWWSVIVRGGLWLLIAVLNNLLANVDQFSQLPQMQWYDWLKFLGGALLAGAIALRLFLDQSITKYGSDQQVPPAPKNPTLTPADKS